MTRIICQLARVLAGAPSKFEGKWEIPVQRDGWETRVSVSIRIEAETLHASISAFGHHTEEMDGSQPGQAYYLGFIGDEPTKRITAEWINNVLAREIETAIMAARSFRDEDLSEGDLPEQYKEAEFYRGMAGYFESTLDHCGK